MKDSNLYAYTCFGGCGAEFDSLDEMVRIEGKDHRGPRHFCSDCAERTRRSVDAESEQSGGDVQ